MKKFQEYIKEANRPGGQLIDRSLEGFKTEMDQLLMLMRSVQNPIAKQTLQPIVNEFYAKMREALVSLNKQGIGYSANYQPRNNPMGGVE